jgi:hypothetical protein
MFDRFEKVWWGHGLNVMRKSAEFNPSLNNSKIPTTIELYTVLMKRHSFTVSAA